MQRKKENAVAWLRTYQVVLIIPLHQELLPSVVCIMGYVAMLVTMSI
eukprot:SAG31_NODE_332_length_17516_cov_3.552840_11_plen_47_part_00